MSKNTFLSLIVFMFLQTITFNQVIAEDKQSLATNVITSDVEKVQNIVQNSDAKPSESVVQKVVENPIMMEELPLVEANTSDTGDNKRSKTPSNNTFESNDTLLKKSNKLQQGITQLAPPISPMASSGKVVLGLVFVVFIIFLLAYIFRRYQQMTPGQGQLIKVMANQPVGVKEKVALIQVGQQQVLIGITSQSINALMVLEPDQQVNISADISNKNSDGQGSDSTKSLASFQDILRKALLK